MAEDSQGDAGRPSGFGPDTIVQVVQHLGKGGLETMSANLAVALRAAGLRSVVVALQDGGALEDVLARGGVEYHVVSGRGYRTPRTHVGLARIFRSTGAQAVHTHHFAALMATVLASKATRVPRLVHTEHAYQYLETAPRSRVALRLLSTQCDAFVVVGASMADYYADVVGVARRRLRVIVNGVDTARYAPAPDRAAARASLGFPSAATLIGTAGRFAEVKNYPMLLRGVAELRKTRPQVGLIMVGDGDDRSALAALADELGYGDAIRFLGWRTDVAEIVKCLDVFALTSWTEGLPLVVLEAMACAVPVVATAVGDLPFLVKEDEAGHLVPPGDHMALAAALAPLVDDVRARHALGARARDAVLRRYAQDAMVRAYIDAYGASVPGAPRAAPSSPSYSHAVQ